MTRKDFDLIAATIRESLPPTARAEAAHSFAFKLGAANTNFDRDRFLKACDIDQTEEWKYGVYAASVDTDSRQITPITRLDADGRKRTIAFIASLEEWERFVTALEAGAGEIYAIRAIDEDDYWDEQRKLNPS
jgi:hypothetical protein